MTRFILLQTGAVSHRAMVKESGQLTALYEIPANGKTPVYFPGMSVAGKISRVDKALGVAFIALQGGGRDGFLPLRQAHDFTEGQKVTVLIKRLGSENKGPILEIASGKTLREIAELSALGSLLDYLEAGQGQTAIATNHASDVAPLLKQHEGILRDLTSDEETELEEAFDDALAWELDLKDGASLVFDELEALTAIDFNLGAGLGQSKKGAIIKSVKAALPLLATQIRARGLGGQIVVDFPGDAYSAREEILAAMKKRLPAKAKIGPFLGSGLLHLTLPRPMPSLLHQLTQKTRDKRPGRRYRPWVLLAKAVRELEQALAADRSESFEIALAPVLFDESANNPNWQAKLAARYGQRFSIVKAYDLGEKKWDIRKKP
jgi:Ribonuclease G/E